MLKLILTTLALLSAPTHAETVYTGRFMCSEVKDAREALEQVARDCEKYGRQASVDMKRTSYRTCPGGHIGYTITYKCMEKLKTNKKGGGKK